MADSGRLVKMEVDYSDAVERRLPEVQEMAKVRLYCNLILKHLLAVQTSVSEVLSKGGF